MPPADPLAPYRTLVEHAEHELALVAAGHWDEVQALRERWTAALAALPARPPAAAEPLLRRALALSEQIEATIKTAQQGVLQELGGVGRQRAVGRAYRPAEAANAPSQLNLSA